jgi:hypothetical protein
MKRWNLTPFLAALFAAALLAAPGEAATRTFTTAPSSTSNETGNLLSAKALFELSGSSLKITLTNESMEDILHNPDVLTGVFFDVAGNPALTKQSANLAGDSYVIRDDPPPGGNVGGEWGYRGNLSHPDVGRYGISGVGLSLFGPGDRFDTSQNLDGQNGLQGLNYGLTSAGDDPTTGTGLVGNGGTPLIHNSVLFTFTVNPDVFQLDDISNVEFQYGTDLCETRLPGTPEQAPEPASVAVLGLAAAGLAARRKKRA